MKIHPVLPVNIPGDRLAPNLPAGANANALPNTKNSVVLYVVKLPANRLSSPVDLPSADARNTRCVADSRVAIDFLHVSGLMMKAEHVNIEAVAAVPPKPRHPPNIGRERGG